VLRADTDIKVVERRIASSRQARETAMSNLRLNLALDAPIEVVPPGDFLPTLPDETALIREAEANRPELAQALVAAEISRLEVAKQRGAYLPTVTADGAWITQRAGFPSDQYGQLSLNLAVPIYSSGEIKGRIALADARRAVTISQLDRDLAELRAWAAAGLLKNTIPSEGVQ
jgi:outer membrane protein TolC